MPQRDPEDLTAIEAAECFFAPGTNPADIALVKQVLRPEEPWIHEGCLVERYDIHVWVHRDELGATEFVNAVIAQSKINPLDEPMGPYQEVTPRAN